MDSLNSICYDLWSYYVAMIVVRLGSYRTKYEDLTLDGLEPSNYRIILKDYTNYFKIKHWIL